MGFLGETRDFKIVFTNQTTTSKVTRSLKSLQQRYLLIAHSSFMQLVIILHASFYLYLSSYLILVCDLSHCLNKIAIRQVSPSQPLPFHIRSQVKHFFSLYSFVLLHYLKQITQSNRNVKKVKTITFRPYLQKNYHNRPVPFYIYEIIPQYRCIIFWNKISQELFILRLYLRRNFRDIRFVKR